MPIFYQYYRKTEENGNNQNGRKRKLSISTNENDEASRYNQGWAEEVAKNLKCPVCFELPRKGSHIYGCKNGHFLCPFCTKKINRCPECREQGFNSRQLAIEKLLSTIPTEYLEYSCRFCEFQSSLEELTGHEYACNERKFNCPRSRCRFSGNLKDILRHNQESNCCYMAEKKNNDEQKEVFKFRFRDLEEESIFLKNTDVSWKPVAFVSETMVKKGMSCLFIKRLANGEWKFLVKTYGPRLRMTITVFNVDKPDPAYSFQGMYYYEIPYSLKKILSRDDSMNIVF